MKIGVYKNKNAYLELILTHIVVVIMHADIDKEIPYRLLSSLYCSTIAKANSLWLLNSILYFGKY